LRRKEGVEIKKKEKEIEKERKRKAKEDKKNQQRQKKAKVAKGKRTGHRVSTSSDAVPFMDDDSVYYEESFFDVCPVCKVLKANEDSEGWLECESCSKCLHVVCAGYDVNKSTTLSFLCATKAHNAHKCQLTVRLTVMKLHFKSTKYVFACCISFSQLF